ncbi:unnamed protein product [Meganyctiphanes norvegica]|uniref:Uncharacterized protein n=1 Tax=Meganyctiphanes norvegica TaxID=48144 RepID=A0AAV2QEI0_MEGNR
MHLQGMFIFALVALLVCALSAPMQNSWFQNRLQFGDSPEDNSPEDYGLMSVEVNSREYGLYSNGYGYGTNQRQQRPINNRYYDATSYKDNDRVYQHNDRDYQHNDRDYQHLYKLLREGKVWGYQKPSGGRGANAITVY